MGEGSGLGLDIARRIVRTRHKGEIRFESRPGETCFEVTLPLCENQARVYGPQAVPPAQVAQVGGQVAQLSMQVAWLQVPPRVGRPPWASPSASLDRRRMDSRHSLSFRTVFFMAFSS